MLRKNFILLLILLIAAFLRFYNLMFDSPYFFNPDEKNMAYAITQLRLPDNFKEIPSCFFNQFVSLPTSLILRPTSYVPRPTCNLNPHFFAYGQFPLYLSFFSDQAVSLLTSIFPRPTSFHDAILWLRFWSATASTLTVLLVYLITKQLCDKCDKVRPCQSVVLLLSAIFAAFTPGLIQSAHFGTTESLLTFFYLLIIYLSILFISKKIHNSSPALPAGRFIILNSLALGLSLATKTSALVFFAVPILAILLTKMKLVNKLFSFLLIVICSLLIFILSSPFNFIDYQSFRGSMNYETSVALGTIKVFYTRQFENTAPVLFQTQKIFPYALGLPIFILGILGFFLMTLQSILYFVSRILYKKIPNTKYEILNTIIVFSFLFYFLPNAFLYAKWTRFMTPIFPLFSIFAVYFISLLYQFINKVYLQNQKSKIKNQIYKLKFKNIFNFLYVVFIFTFLFLILLPGLTFFTIYTRKDTRIQTSEWVYQNIPSGSYILSETGNVVDIPVPLPFLDARRYFLDAISFNFYDLDQNPPLFEELLNHLDKADYIFVPSRRVFANVLRLPDQYPKTAKYYELLFSGNLGFAKVAEFSSFPKLEIRNWELEIVDELGEETWTVFDHPVVRIYKKLFPYSESQYQSLFTQ